jgi:hypothetical protein
MNASTDTSTGTSNARPRSARRPVAVLIALFVGLGALGAAGGTALGAVGAASADAPSADRHHHHGAERGPRPVR